MPRLEGLGYRQEDNMYLLEPQNGRPQVPPKPGDKPPNPVGVPAVNRSSVTLTDDVGGNKKKPTIKPLNTAQCTSIIDAMKEGVCLSQTAHVRLLMLPLTSPLSQCTRAR
jgi:hypothetical protein